MSIPDKYKHLNGQVPPILEHAIPLYGTQEVKGDGNNARIIAWADEVGGWEADFYNKDSIPWCGLFMAVVAKRAGYRPVNNWLKALSWASFGTSMPFSEASLGDVLVFTRQGGGHVGIYVGEDATHYYVFGGNQGDAVSIMKMAKDRVYSVNRPKWKYSQPECVKPVNLSVSENISENEA